MSDTLANTAARVRLIVDDTNPSDYVCSTLRLYEIIDQCVQDVAGRLQLGVSWLASAITLAPGTADYTLPVGEYMVISELRLQSLGWLLQKLSNNEMERRRQVPSGSIATGIPTYYTLLEDSAQLVTVRVWPIPTAADAIDVLREMNPPRVTLDADTIPFGRQALSAVEAFAAARVIRSLAPDLLQKRSLSPALADSLDAQGQTFLRNANIRIGRQRRLSRIVLEDR